MSPTDSSTAVAPSASGIRCSSTRTTAAIGPSRAASNRLSQLAFGQRLGDNPDFRLGGQPHPLPELRHGVSAVAVASSRRCVSSRVPDMVLTIPAFSPQDSCRGERTCFLEAVDDGSIGQHDAVGRRPRGRVPKGRPMNHEGVPALPGTPCLTRARWRGLGPRSPTGPRVVPSSPWPSSPPQSVLAASHGCDRVLSGASLRRRPAPAALAENDPPRLARCR